MLHSSAWSALSARDNALPEKVFLMPLMSLCHKPFVYKGWASDIKWHYRPKSDIKLQSTPVFGDFFAIMLFTPYIYFILIKFYQTYRLTFLNSISSSKSYYIQIINMIEFIWKYENSFWSWMNKRLPKFINLLCNLIMPTRM